MSEPILLIFDDALAASAEVGDLIRSAEGLKVPIVCFPIRERGAAPIDPITQGVAVPRLLRWTDHDPLLRWQALQNLIDRNKFQAVGFVGARSFEQLGQRVADHAMIPSFVYLAGEDFSASISERTLWVRGLPRLQLCLLADKAARRRFESVLPPPHPYQVTSLMERADWPRWLVGDMPKPQPALATLVTPVFNRAEYTVRCARSVLAHTRRPFEWILIDNGSSDSTPKELKRLEREFKGIKVIRNSENLGFARAVNQGLRRARGATIVILNNDTIVPAGWLEGLQACFDRDPGLGAVGPCTNEAADAPQRRPANYPIDHFDSFAAAWSLRHAGRIQPMHRLIAFCVAIRRDALEQVGLLDERFHIGGYEDYDYCLRLRQAGWRLAVAEEVFVHHFGHVSFKDSEFWQQTTQANRDIFVDKWTRKSLEFLDDISTSPV